MFAKNLKRIRKAKKVSQASLGAKIGKTQQIVSWYESGRVSPSVAVLEEIAAALDVPVTQLIASVS